MDFSIWFILESKVGVKKLQLNWFIEASTQSSIEPETVRKCCADARRRFEAGIEAEGGYFEKKNYVCFL